MMKFFTVEMDLQTTEWGPGEWAFSYRLFCIVFPLCDANVVSIWFHRWYSSGKNNNVRLLDCHWQWNQQKAVASVKTLKDRYMKLTGNIFDFLSYFYLLIILNLANIFFRFCKHAIWMPFCSFFYKFFMKSNKTYAIIIWYVWYFEFVCDFL